MKNTRLRSVLKFPVGKFDVEVEVYGGNYSNERVIGAVIKVVFGIRGMPKSEAITDCVGDEFLPEDLKDKITGIGNKITKMFSGKFGNDTTTIPHFLANLVAECERQWKSNFQSLKEKSNG